VAAPTEWLYKTGSGVKPAGAISKKCVHGPFQQVSTVAVLLPFRLLSTAQCVPRFSQANPMRLAAGILVPLSAAASQCGSYYREASSHCVVTMPTARSWSLQVAYVDISPVNYHFAVHSMSSEMVPFQLPMVRPQPAVFHTRPCVPAAHSTPASMICISLPAPFTLPVCAVYCRPHKVVRAL
jgi:hypothetical protein